MIYYNGKEIYEIVKDSKQFIYLRKGLALLWEAVRSCFGTGIWKQEKKWINDDHWKNNKK